MITIYDPKTHTLTRREETSEEIEARERERAQYEKSLHDQLSTEERISDVEAALVELAELYAAQNDVIAKLSKMIEEA